MSFNAKNPFISPKATTTPPTPMPGTEGLFPMNDGWYRIDENGNTYKFVTDNNYVHTDNNYTATEKYKVNSAVKKSSNASQIVAFNNYEEFVEYFNNSENLPNCTFPPISGQIIVIKDPNVPHLLVKSVNKNIYSSRYEFKSNEEFLADMERYPDEGLIVGYHTFSLLETKKDALPTKTSDLLNDSNFVQDAKYVHTDNNFTNEEKEKLQSVENGSQKNMIETVKVNGNSLSIKEKAVDINVPTKLSELSNDGNFVQDANYVHTDNNYNSAQKKKLLKIEDEAQVNVIESVKVNGTDLSVSNKSVDVSVPTNLSELNNDGNFVQDSKYVHTDNNFTNDYKSLISANQRSALTAIAIARGANQAKSFNTYSEMIGFFNQNPNWGIIGDVTLNYQVGQNIMIGTVNVPDLWIAVDASGGYSKYTYTTDETFANDLNNALANGEFLRVGWVALGVLETQKVDLTDYSTTEQMNSVIQTAVDTVLDGQVAINKNDIASLFEQMQWGEF